MLIGFIGLGKMGRPMAEALIRDKYEVVVHNRSRSVIDEMVSLGATAVHSPAEVAERSDIIFTCLAVPEDVERILIGPTGAIEGARTGKLFVDASTIEPDRSRRIGKALAERGIGFLDAPVSGGPPAALSRSLAILAGGEAADFRKAEPVLRSFGDNIFHLGPVGSGSLAKLCNQILASVHQALACEVMVMGAKGGLDATRLYEALRVSSGQSRGMERAIGRFVLPRDFSAKATIDLILKDLECAMEAAANLGIKQTLAPVAAQMYYDAVAQGHGEKDIAAVILPLEERAQVKVNADLAGTESTALEGK